MQMSTKGSLGLELPLTCGGTTPARTSRRINKPWPLTTCLRKGLERSRLALVLYAEGMFAGANQAGEQRVGGTRHAMLNAVPAKGTVKGIDLGASFLAEVFALCSRRSEFPLLQVLFVSQNPQLTLSRKTRKNRAWS